MLDADEIANAAIAAGMDPQRARLGAQRMAQFVSAQGQLHAEAMSLTMSIGYAPGQGYSDDALAAIERDSRDLITAAHALADLGRRLAREWGKQRRDEERRGKA